MLLENNMELQGLNAEKERKSNELEMLRKRHNDFRRQMDQKTRYNSSFKGSEGEVASRPRIDSLEQN